jgi:hypothetical protein
MPSKTEALSGVTHEYAETLTDATLGLDRVYRQESGDDTGLVVLDLSAEHEPEPFTGYGDADSRFADLRTRAKALPEPDRAVYYRQFCESMLAFIEWREDGLELSEQIERFLHVPSDPPSATDLDAIRDDLGAVLSEIGYEGSVSEQCTAWKNDTTVATDEATEVLSESMTKMRAETLATFNLPDDAVATMNVEGVSGASFNAMCDFANWTVVINTDPQLTRPWLRKLAVHEGYPGHALQLSLRKHWHETGAAPADGLLSVVNCASSTTFEGIADSGLTLAGVGDAYDEAASLVGRYQAGIATAGAWRYHHEGWSEDELGDWLADRAVYGDEGWVRNRVKFVTAPERATLMWSYWYGEPSVTDAINSVDATDRDAFVRFLYGRMHSSDSLAEFFA